MPAKYEAISVADYFLWKAQKDDQEFLSNLKLQKLVYYAQGMHLAMFNEPLFDDDIKAWQYGPVVSHLYHRYKNFGNSGIPADENFNPNVIDNETQSFLDEIYDVFGQFSDIRLMELTHSDKCWEDVEIGETISHESMKQCLKKYLANG